MQKPQMDLDSTYALHDISSTFLTQYYRTALQGAGNFFEIDYTPLEDDIINTFRTLAQYQNDISASDAFFALSVYRGPAEAMEVLLSNSLLPLERFYTTEGSYSTPLLAKALECYGRQFFIDGNTSNRDWWDPWTSCPQERKQWETLITRLIHKGADLHAPVFRRVDVNCVNLHEPFQVSQYGTPLDSLLEYSRTPDEARRLGAEWLRLLASKGQDVVAYLEKEKMLHSSQHQITYPNFWFFLDPSPHELQFTFDDARPCVWWEWWIDPASHMDLLEHEFTQLVKHTSALPQGAYATWRDMWPFYYPVWHHSGYPQVHELVKRRANRRLQKRYAKSRHCKRSRYPQMPGAWPAQS